MANLTYDFVYLPASSAFQADQSIVKPAFDIMKAENPNPKWVGLQEGASTYWGVTVWDSIDAHKAFQTSATFPAFWDAIVPVAANPSSPGAEYFHAHFKADPSAALNAGVTRIALLTANAGHTKAEVEALGDKLVGLIQGGGAAHGVTGAAVGSIVEHPDKVILVFGWESKEAQDKSSDPNGPAAAVIKEAETIATSSYNSVKLTKY
ncbi:hypothetical protein K488DRAFT_91194 [Vararia minispora EC-137]|uniref:Uncharacterized protein n=1 Tax=Vararia minispora EC-137 TaxID=1314806 RepID=A0ACB8Q5X6_9AGAM|nr:hypothetical protein K488DRAFT_91194 [Vararia minispora EC-137]